MVEADTEAVFTIRDDNPIYTFPFDRQELTVEFAMPESKSGRDKDRYFVPCVHFPWSSNPLRPPHPLFLPALGVPAWGVVRWRGAVAAATAFCARAWPRRHGVPTRRCRGRLTHAAPNTPRMPRYRVALVSEHELQAWHIHKAVAHVASPRDFVSEQLLVCVFRVSRASLPHILNIWLILFLMSILTYGAYLVPVTDVGDRSSITLTILLTAVAFRFILQDSLPQMSYLTTVDYYVLWTFILICATAIMTLVTAGLLGVTDTISCGSGCQNYTILFNEATEGEAGRYTGEWEYNTGFTNLQTEQVLSIEYYTCIVSVGIGLLLNVWFIFIGIKETIQCNREYGPTIDNSVSSTRAGNQLSPAICTATREVNVSGGDKGHSQGALAARDVNEVQTCAIVQDRAPPPAFL